MNNKAFTLIELLVVVLIIGILAAIALPQYKFAVAKSKYATLKNVTKSLKESVDRFYLTNGTLPTKFSDLDIDLVITGERNKDDVFTISFQNSYYCEVYHISSNRHIICQKEIFGINMTYTESGYPRLEKICSVYSKNISDIPNKVCQAETGKTAEQASLSGPRYIYYY